MMGYVVTVVTYGTALSGFGVLFFSGLNCDVNDSVKFAGLVNDS
jgi:hypothetical protein